MLHVLSHCVSVRLEFAQPRTLLSTCVVCVCVVLHAVRVFIGCVHSCYVLCCVALLPGPPLLPAKLLAPLWPPDALEPVWSVPPAPPWPSSRVPVWPEPPWFVPPAPPWPSSRVLVWLEPPWSGPALAILQGFCLAGASLVRPSGSALAPCQDS